MSTNLYPIRHLDDGDFEVRLTSDLWPLPAGSVVLFSPEVAPDLGNWVLYRRRGRDLMPQVGTWPTPGGKRAWLATAAEVISAPDPAQVAADRAWRLRAWGLGAVPRRGQRAGVDRPGGA